MSIQQGARANITRLTRRLNAMGERGIAMSKAIIQSSADLMVTEAKRNAPADLGALRQSIGKETVGEGFIARIFVNAPYAAYVEFGTGQYVSVPAELADIAATYKGKGNGSFEQFKVAIKDWMQRKGIDPKYAYVIMMQILYDGIRPHPFFYPAFQKTRADLPKKLKLALEREIANNASRA